MTDKILRIKGVAKEINKKEFRKIDSEELNEFEKAMEIVAPFVKQTKPAPIQIMEYNLSK